LSASAAPHLARVTELVTRHRRWVVFAMLLSLHAALVSTPGGDFQRVWLLVHFGLFLLWQPFIAAEREIDVVGAVLLFAITLFTISFLAGWMIVGWLLVLLGILGGRVFTVQAERRGRFYLVAFTYVLAILVLRAVPALLLPGEAVPAPVAVFASAFLPLMLGLLTLLPFRGREEGTQVFDFFYAVLVFQLGLVVVLGSVATMRYTADHYFAAVALTLLGFGAALFVLAALWNPLRGFGGLRTYFSRYLLSVGMPFELWMRRVAELAETEADSRRFIELALAEVAEFPWVKGGTWRSSEGEGRFGSNEGHATSFNFHGLEVVFNTEIRLSPALFLHMRLLAQVVGEFYEGKRREQALRRNSYLQAVHETGARLTHDVKNLLQSLYALTSIAPRQDDPALAGGRDGRVAGLGARLVGGDAAAPGGLRRGFRRDPHRRSRDPRRAVRRLHREHARERAGQGGARAGHHDRGVVHVRRADGARHRVRQRQRGRSGRRRAPPAGAGRARNGPRHRALQRGAHGAPGRLPPRARRQPRRARVLHASPRRLSRGGLRAPPRDPAPTRAG
jgi:hypothetical protein